MKIQEIINEIRNNEVGILSITLKDASRYAENAKGKMNFAGTLFTKKYANRQHGDEVLTTGNKETNITEVQRTLETLVGKGDVEIRLLNNKCLCGRIEL